MSSNSENLDKRLRDWLESQGYPLEMAVSRVFQKYGFHTLQSEYYSDPESGAVREIDVVAYSQHGVHGMTCRITFTIECKVSREKPWILFTSEMVHLANPAKVAQRAASILGHRFLHKLAHRKEVHDLAIFQLKNRSGYSLTQAFTSGQDITYTAATSVAKASLAQAIEADQSTRLQMPACEIVFPIIVIDGKLFECYFGEDSQVVLSEISSGILIWRNPMVRMPHTIIQVLTLASLEKFVSDARTSTEFLLLSCDSECGQVAKEYKESLKKRPTKRKA
jgi:Holliday junction resolvase